MSLACQIPKESAAQCAVVASNNFAHSYVNGADSEGVQGSGTNAVSAGLRRGGGPVTQAAAVYDLSSVARDRADCVAVTHHLMSHLLRHSRCTVMCSFSFTAQRAPSAAAQGAV